MFVYPRIVVRAMYMYLDLLHVLWTIHVSDILSIIYKQQHQITTVTNQIAVNKTTVITCLVSHTTTPTTMTTMATTLIGRDLTLSFVDDVNLVGREVVFETHPALVGRTYLMPRPQMSYERLLFLIYFVAYLTDKLQQIKHNCY